MNSTTATPNAGNTTPANSRATDTHAVFYARAHALRAAGNHADADDFNALANITTADREWVLKSELRIFDARGQFSTEACCAIEMARADSRGEQI